MEAQIAWKVIIVNHLTAHETEPGASGLQDMNVRAHRIGLSWVTDVSLPHMRQLRDAHISQLNIW